MSTKKDHSLEKYAHFITGTCMSMCPEKERLLREREGLLHRFENCDSCDLNTSAGIYLRGGRKTHLNKADPDKTVKCFSRSAAGHKTPDPSDLRPAPVLQKTVAYLLTRIAGECVNDEYWVERYHFVADRLRAVRQDMVIQSLSATDSIKILEPIVRFYCYSSYRLCEQSMDTYDPKLNLTHLQECIKRLLVLYDSVTESEETVACKLLRNQSEIEALYLLINLGDVNAITRALERSSCDRSEQLALRLSLAWFHGNYVRVSRLIEDLPPLGLCVVCTQLPYLRKRALRVMTTAYSSKVLKVPLQYLKKVLKWCDTEHACRECNSYGITVKTEEGEKFVSFLKGSFRNDIQQGRPRQEEWIQDVLLKSDFKKIMFPSSPEEN